MDQPTRPQTDSLASRAGAIILAGGRGTRLGALGEQTPKPLLPVAGRPFVEWPMALMAQAGVRRFVISLGHRAQVAETYFRQRPTDGLAVETAVEPGPLGTAGGFAFAAERCADAETLLVANGDSLLVTPLGDLWRILGPDVDGVLLATEVDDAARYGSLETSSDDLLVNMREKVGGTGKISVGVYLFKRALLERLPATLPLSFETDVFPAWISEGVRLRVHAVRAPFIDIGLPESLGAADAFVATHVAPILSS